MGSRIWGHFIKGHCHSYAVIKCFLNWSFRRKLVIKRCVQLNGRTDNWMNRQKDTDSPRDKNASIWNIANESVTKCSFILYICFQLNSYEQVRHVRNLSPRVFGSLAACYHKTSHKVSKRSNKNVQLIQNDFPFQRYVLSGLIESAMSVRPVVLSGSFGWKHQDILPSNAEVNAAHRIASYTIYDRCTNHVFDGHFWKTCILIWSHSLYQSYVWKGYSGWNIRGIEKKYTL
jgi:hypothetical protein